MKKKELKFLLFIFLAAIITRGLVLFFTILGSDEITVGLMTLRVMEGDFPVFFSGQNFMGSLEAFLGGSFFHFIGPSPTGLELLAVILSILFLVLLYLLSKTFFGYKTALISVALLAIPPRFFLGWSHEARLHYPLALILGNFLLLLSHKVTYEEVTPATQRALYLLIGLLAGIGWWTNYLIITYLLPVGLFLLLKDKRILFSKNFILLLFMFLLGSLPLWAYNVIHHFPITGMTKVVDLADIIPYLKAFFINALPMLLGFQPPLSNDPLALAGYIIIGPIYFMAFIYFMYRFRSGFTSISSLRLDKTTGGEILLFLFSVAILLNLLTTFGSRLSDDDQKYLLPLYTCLPVFVSVLLVDMGKKSYLFSLALLGLILFSNLTGNLRHDGWIILDSQKLLTYRNIDEKENRLIDFLAKNGYTHFYCSDLGKRLTFKSKGALVSAYPFVECSKYADRVDASPKAVYLSSGEDKNFEENLNAIGGSYRRVTAPDGYLLYTDFKPPPNAYRLLPRHLWTGTSNLNPSEVKNAFDGDVFTGWGTKGPQKKGTYFLLDLGRVETIGKISYIPASYADVPAGYQVAVSLDGRNWQVVASVSNYEYPIFWSGPTPMMKARHGRVETVFSPHPCRYLKISLLQDSADAHWSINELFLFSPDDENGKNKTIPPRGQEIDLLLTFLKARKIHFVYADPWLSAVIRVKSDWKMGTVASNYLTGENGEIEPSADRLERTHIDRKTALIIEKEDSDLETILGENHYFYRKEKIGPFFAYYGFSRPKSQPSLPVTNWEVTSNANPLDARKAIDRDPKTRWDSGKPQEPGLYYQIDLKTVQSVRGFTLSLGKSIHDYPRFLRVLSSLDGSSWQEIKGTASSELYWTGATLLKMTGEKTLFSFSPVRLRYLRLLEEGQDPVYFWSIHELELF
jgi:4-amino-4-deoxy-L-arabinose transferase-like glycosyltransferase